MSTKTRKEPSSSFRYTPEEVAPRDPKEDESFVEEFISRNRDRINAELKVARESIRNGKGKRYTSAEDLAADLMSELARDSGES